MSWSGKSNFDQVIKENGKCFIRSQWRFCPYWIAECDSKSGKPHQYKCNLFNKTKSGNDSLPECNAQYGRTRKPPPI